MLTVQDTDNFDWKKITLARCAEGNATDTYFTSKVYIKLLDEIRAKGLEKLYEKLISPLSCEFARIENEGLLIDSVKLTSLKEELLSKIKDVEDKLKSSNKIPKDCNLGSNQQLIEVLFSLYKDPETKEWMQHEDRGFGLYPVAWTSKGQPSTDEESLTKLKTMVEEEYVKRGLNVKE